jgi:hypothetical protein
MQEEIMANGPIAVSFEVYGHSSETQRERARNIAARSDTISILLLWMVHR